MTANAVGTVAPFDGEVIATVGAMASPRPMRWVNIVTEFCRCEHTTPVPGRPQVRAVLSPHWASTFWNVLSPLKFR